MEATRLWISFFSLLPLVTAVAISAKHSNRLGLIHFHLLFVGLFYGAYTFVDVLVNDDFARIGVPSVALLMGSITLSMLLMAAVFGQLPHRLSYRFSVRYLVQVVETVPFSILVGAWLGVVVWYSYIYNEFRIISHVNYDSLQDLGILLPSWFGSVKQLSVTITFSIFIWLVVSLSVIKKNKYLIIRVIMLITVVLLLSVNGRRSVLGMLVVGGIIWSVARDPNTSLFNSRMLLRAALAFAVLVLFSNLFENIRGHIHAYTYVGTPFPTDFSFYDAMFRFQSTYRNLEVRMALWRFHYFIMEFQSSDLTNMKNVMGGELIWAGLISAIPRYFLPGKGIVLADDVLVCNHYPTICPGSAVVTVDFPQSLYSGLQADSGLFFILLAPIFVFAVLLLVARCGRFVIRTVGGRERYILVFGISAELLINIEQSVGNYFVYVRDVAIITVCVWLLRLPSSLAVHRSTPSSVRGPAPMKGFPTHGRGKSGRSGRL